MDEIANMTLLAVSDLCPSLTGEDIIIDGGAIIGLSRGAGEHRPRCLALASVFALFILVALARRLGRCPYNGRGDRHAATPTY